MLLFVIIHLLKRLSCSKRWSQINCWQHLCKIIHQILLLILLIVRGWYHSSYSSCLSNCYLIDLILFNLRVAKILLFNSINFLLFLRFVVFWSLGFIRLLVLLVVLRAWSLSGDFYTSLNRICSQCTSLRSSYIFKDWKSRSFFACGVEFKNVWIFWILESSCHLIHILFNHLWVAYWCSFGKIEGSCWMSELTSKAVWAVECFMILFAKFSLILGRDMLLLLKLWVSVSKSTTISKSAFISELPVSTHLCLVLCFKGLNRSGISCVKQSKWFRGVRRILRRWHKLSYWDEFRFRGI